jgi:Ca-activated chloride channel family protein
MLAEDVQPSRLQRAVHKIRDLLALRPGARVALVAYAGSAHEVVPFTTDAKLITDFAAELEPQLMPLAGNDVNAAIARADGLLSRAGLAGSVLLIADSVRADDLTRPGTGAPVDILAMAAPPDAPAPRSGPPAPALDRPAMAAAARALGGRLEEVSVSDADVRSLARRFDLRPSGPLDGSGARWRDGGYYLLFPLTGLVLLWFRRGWAVRWDG